MEGFRELKCSKPSLLMEKWNRNRIIWQELLIDTSEHTRAVACPRSFRRRVSYVIPPPTEPIPRLQLSSTGVSRLGAIGPLLVPARDSLKASPKDQPWHPRHRLGVASLALDTSTVLSGGHAPEGILYTGGRDGMVMSWDLGIPMRKRRKNNIRDSRNEDYERHVGKWEIMTGWDDDAIEEEGEEDERVTSDGDVLGDVTAASRGRKRALTKSKEDSYGNQWETNVDALPPGKPSQFRQCTQAHTDWVNDVLLCNYNQTVISGSSDGTIQAWNPHSPNNPEPTVIGLHDDYVRCLSLCRDRNWIVSGSFDRTIKLWDLNQSSSTPSPSEPLLTFNPADASAPKSSVYALAADPFGHAIASGSPERVVRLWDPRTGRRTGKLVGHTDNIRAILISEDARYLLTGSADASIKLWSLSSQRCLHTFTHHTESVWALYSSHPSLLHFYTADKSGLVTSTNVENCSDIGDGECIVLCKDADGDGVNKMIVMDDSLLWTASGTSSIRRWRIPQRRAAREPQPEREESPWPRETSVAPSIASASEPWQPLDRDEESGTPYASLVRLTSPNDPFAPYTSLPRGRDAEVATLYSAASVMSVPKTAIRSPLRSVFARTDELRREEPSRREDVERAAYEERELAANAQPLLLAPDTVIPGDAGLVRSVMLNDRMHSLTVNTMGEVAVWDVVRCMCRGRVFLEDILRAGAGGCKTSDVRSKEWSPREVLETVRELIEGEAVVVPWAAVDTKTGVLTVHLNDKCFEAEVYADEVGFPHDRQWNDESRLNIGKWVLRNLFLGFIREEQRIRRTSSSIAGSIRRGVAPQHIDFSPGTSPSSSSLQEPAPTPSSIVISSPKMIPAIPPMITTSSMSTPVIPMKEAFISLGSMQMPVLSTDVTPRPLKTQLDGQTPHPTMKEGDYFSMRKRSGSVAETSDDAGSKPDALPPTTPGGGLMGRLKSFGKISGKKNAGEAVPTPGGTLLSMDISSIAEESSTPGTAATTPQQLLLAGTLTPPPSSEVPIINLQPNISLVISDEAALGWTPIYRGTVASTAHDVRSLEDAIPMWLLEYLLLNKAPPVPVTKLSFILLPYPCKSPDEEQLPELLNTTQSKLTASRFLRVRKLVIHVQDKLEKITGSPRTPSTPRSSVDVHARSSSPRVTGGGSPRTVSALPKAEDVYEILCNDNVLPLDMTLAAVRQFVWRQANELTMYYRRKLAV